MDIKKTAGWIILIILAIGILIAKSGLLQGTGEVERAPLNEFPAQINGYTSHELPYPDWLDEALKAEEFFIRDYEKGSEHIKLYAAYFTSRRGTSTHNPDVCYPAQGWEIAEARIRDIKIGDKTYQISERRVKRGKEQILVMFWYQAGDNVYADKLKHQLYVIKNALLSGSMRAGIVRVSMNLDKVSLDEAREKTIAFSKEVIPLMEAYLP